MLHKLYRPDSPTSIRPGGGGITSDFPGNRVTPQTFPRNIPIFALKIGFFQEKFVDRRTIAYGLVLVIVAALLAGLIVYLLIDTPPSGYTRPEDFSPDRLQDQAAKLFVVGTKVANTLSDRSGGTPLDVTFVDEMINGQIRLLPPAKLRKLPPWLNNPQVVFDTNGIRLMADVDYRGKHSVVSLRLAPSATTEGNLQLDLAGASAGRLPLPAAIRELMNNDVDLRLRKAEARAAGSDAAPEPFVATTSSAARPEEILLGRQADLAALRAMHHLLHGEPAVLRTTDQGLFIETVEPSDHCLRIIGHRVDKK